MEAVKKLAAEAQEVDLTSLERALTSAKALGAGKASAGKTSPSSGKSSAAKSSSGKTSSPSAGKASAGGKYEHTLATYDEVARKEWTRRKEALERLRKEALQAVTAAAQSSCQALEDAVVRARRVGVGDAPLAEYNESLARKAAKKAHAAADAARRGRPVVPAKAKAKEGADAAVRARDAAAREHEVALTELSTRMSKQESLRTQGAASAVVDTAAGETEKAARRCAKAAAAVESAKLAVIDAEVVRVEAEVRAQMDMSQFDQIELDLSARQLRLRRPIEFNGGVTTFTKPATAEKQLRQVARALAACNQVLARESKPLLRLSIEGHINDNTGRDQVDLSGQRARACHAVVLEQYAEAMGVAADQADGTFKTVGFGGSRPVDLTYNTGQNRRVEMRVIAEGEE